MDIPILLFSRKCWGRLGRHSLRKISLAASHSTHRCMDASCHGAHAEGHWLALVHASLQWLWEHSGAASAHACWERAWDEWKKRLACRPKMWRRILRWAQQSAMQKEVLKEGWQQCCGTLVRGLVQWGATAQGLRDAALRLSGTVTHFCGSCQKLFASKPQWAVSASKCTRE